MYLDLDREIITVLGKMSFYKNLFTTTSKYKNLIPFLVTYEKVTLKVISKYVENKTFYQSWYSMKKLDVLFAEKYFRPLKAFLKRKKIPSPWQNYFKICKTTKNYPPIFYLLIGINCHINSDLYECLCRLKYRSKDDFEKINQILESLIEEVLTYLAFEDKDIIAFGGLVFKQIAHEEFRKVIVKWRDQAWINYQNRTKEDFKTNLESIKYQTEQLTLEIKKIFDELYTPQNAINAIDAVTKLNLLKVVI